MKPIQQSLDEVVASLTEMDAEWLDETASKIIGKLSEIADHRRFSRDTLRALLDEDFKSALTVFRLFLDISKDRMDTVLPEGGPGRLRL